MTSNKHIDRTISANDSIQTGPFPFLLILLFLLYNKHNAIPTNLARERRIRCGRFNGHFKTFKCSQFHVIVKKGN